MSAPPIQGGQSGRTEPLGKVGGCAGIRVQQIRKGRGELVRRKNEIGVERGAGLRRGSDIRRKQASVKEAHNMGTRGIRFLKRKRLRAPVRWSETA